MATPCDRLRWTTDGSRRLARLAISSLAPMILVLPSRVQAQAQAQNQDLVVSDLTLALELQKQPDVSRAEARKEPDGERSPPPFDERAFSLTRTLIVFGSAYLILSRFLAHRAEQRRAKLELDKVRLNAAKDVANQLLKTLRDHRDAEGDLGASLAELVQAVTQLEPAKKGK